MGRVILKVIILGPGTGVHELKPWSHIFGTSDVVVMEGGLPHFLL